MNVEKTRTENWNGYDIRFLEIDGEWLAILKDICNALNLKTFDISQRLDPSMMARVPVIISNNYNNDMGSTHNVDRKPHSLSGAINKTHWMLAVNELGIYETLFASRKLEARKFRHWTAGILRKLRKSVGLEGYEIMQMTDSKIQEDIDHILDELFWDPETGMLMRSVTVAGGDVEQVPYE